MSTPRCMTTWILLFILYSISAVAAQDSDEVKIPAPFDKYTDVELLRQLYPDYDPRTRLLGKGIVDDEGRQLGGELYGAKIWKGEGRAKLLVMVETYTPEKGKRPDYGAAAYGIDVALFDIKRGRLTLAAKLRNASSHTGHSWVNFDLAPYGVKRGLVALGLRWGYSHMGEEKSALSLFIRSGTIFRLIFEREMDASWWGGGDELKANLSVMEMKEIYQLGETETMAYKREAVLQVVPGKGEYNNFKISERGVERQNDGTLLRKTITEIWSWDSTKQVYVRHKQG